MRRRARESGADPQIKPADGAAQQGPKARPGEAEPIRPDIAGGLRQSGLDQRQVEPQPVQRDRAKGEHDSVLALLRGQARLSVGGAAQGAQQAELVGGALLVVEDDMAQPRQRAGAVVRQTQGNTGPAHLRAAHLIGHRRRARDQGAVPAREVLEFGKRHRVHAAFGAGRTLTQGEGEHAARTQQAQELAQRAIALGRYDVLPHAAEQDQVEGKTEAMRNRQRGQAIGKPAHPGCGVPAGGLGAQRGRGFDGDHVIALSGQPGGIAPAARAHIED